MGHKGKNYTVGIDVGGTKILVALLDHRFQILSQIKTKTQAEKGEHRFLKKIAESVRYVLKEADVSRSEVIGVGVGCPGVINPRTGIVASSPNIPFLQNCPLAHRLTHHLGLSVTLGNDVQTGLYGEHQFGAAKGFHNVVGIFMGTGVGGAIILNNRPYLGASGSAGELGHIQIDPQGPLCGCGHRGCLEAFAGRLAIASQAAVAVLRQQAPYLARKVGADVSEIKSSELSKALQAGDRTILELIRSRAQQVGSVMANIVNLLNPDLFVLGGGLVEAMPRLIAREAEHAMRQHALQPLAAHVRVAVAKLKDYSVVLGAAKKAAEQFGEG